MFAARLAALSRQWRDYPPVHLLVASDLEAGKFGRGKHAAETFSGDAAWDAL